MIEMGKLSHLSGEVIETTASLEEIVLTTRSQMMDFDTENVQTILLSRRSFQVSLVETLVSKKNQNWDYYTTST